MRQRVVRRDGGICHLCGQPGADTADHLLPWSKGGRNTMDNLRAAHGECNRRRSDRPVEVARGEIAAARNDQGSGWDW
jgi:5-methylcytosine-specific restriction endonuclease McrA